MISYPIIRFSCISLLILLIFSVFPVSAAEESVSDRTAEMLASRETLLSVYFRNGSSVLDYKQVDQIDMIADKVRELDPGRYMVRIEGSASPEGSDAQNFDLSFARGEAVWKYLRIAHRIDPTSLYITGLGPQSGDRKDWPKLRRADIVVYRLTIIVDETASASPSP